MITAADDRLAIGAVVVDPVTTEDELGFVSCIGSRKDPEEANIPTFVKCCGEVVELGVGVIEIVDNHNRFRLCPINPIGTFRPSDGPALMSR